MTAYDRNGPDRRRQHTGCKACCFGCLGIVVAFATVSMVAYSRTGRYRPRIGPPRAAPVPNAYDDYMAAGTLLKANGGLRAMYGTKPGTESIIMPALRDMSIARNAGAFARIQTAFGKDSLAPSAPRTSDGLADLMNFRDMGRMLLAKVDMLSERGDRAGACAAALDAWQMGHQMPRGGAIPHLLAGIACRAYAARPMARLADKLDAGVCDNAIGRMQKAMRRPYGPGQALAEERRCLLTSMVELDKSPEALAQFIMSATVMSSTLESEPSAEAPFTAIDLLAQMGSSGRPWNPPASLQALSGFGWRLMRDNSLRDIERHLTQMQTEWSKPRWLRLQVPDPSDPVAFLHKPALDQAIARSDRADAQDRILLCALAVRARRMQTGRLPASLNEIAVDAAFRTDPYTGKALRYRPSGREYLLYSVGPDGKDDGGVPADESSAGASGDLGLRPFRSPLPGEQPGYDYRRVPHMKPPKLAPGDPTLLK